jgi:hypothetical protein
MLFILVKCRWHAMLVAPDCAEAVELLRSDMLNLSIIELE